jgi:epoxide hydrolase
VTTDAIAPYRVEIPDSDLADVKARLERVRRPDELDGVGWDYGVPGAYTRELTEYWHDSYDWRAGVAFSAPTTEPGWDTTRVARPG